MRWLSYFILAYLALGAQVAVRPFVSVGEAVPNFLLMIVVFLAMNAPREPALLGCFFLGLMQDLLTLQALARGPRRTRWSRCSSCRCRRSSTGSTR